MFSAFVRPVRAPAPFLTVLMGRGETSFADEAAALRPVVRAVVASIVREPLDHPDVEDCTSETLRRALEGKGSMAGEATRAWVIGIARHVALDTLRARKRARARTEQPPACEDDAAPRVEALPDPADDPFERVAHARRDAGVRAAIASLPDGPRAALTLFHLEGLGYQEIATRLAVPLGTVATWVTRGRKAVATAVADLARDS